MTIQESNKLIAEFDGLKFVNDDPESYPNGYMFSKDTGALTFEDLQYNESWDWLMPVIEKIENLKNKEGAYAFSVRIGRDYCVIAYNDFTGYEIAVKSAHNNKIQSVYECIVEFIKWHNNNHANHAKL